ncbi:MAG: sensor histidine kinase, partial [Nitrososphaerales archaeon]
DCAGSLGATLGGHSYFVTALVSRGHAIGALYVADHGSTAARPGAAPALNTSEQLLTSFAYFAATALENARLYQDAYEKRRELEAVLAGIGDGVVVAGTDLSLILMNPVARDILGFEAEPPAGQSLHPYLSAPAFADLLAQTLATGQEQIRELDLTLPVRSPAARQGRWQGGDVRTYGALASPVLGSSGEVTGVVAVLRDVTTQKEVERMKSNFLSVVSHELRTPLHSIKGFVEIILMGKTGPVTELQEDFLKTVRTQTTVLQRMIDDLLEFSRMEAGRIKLNLEEVSLSAIAHGVATKLAPLAEEAGLTLYMDFPDDLPTIDGDRVRLEQVLTNLVENSIKFTPQDGEITIGARRNGDTVRLTIRDTGIGIPPEEQEKVFDRFYQVDRGEKRAYRGTGLGLPISRHIVERHNGTIWIDSDGIAGHGTSFHVELPLELRLAEAPTIDFATPRATAPSNPRK